jgi:glycosyltransferase involved in cell wall biosynthesis
MSGEGHAGPKRPHVVERRAHAPNLPVEEFMVPVLETAIRTVLEDLPQDHHLFEAEATRKLYLSGARDAERFQLVPYGVPIGVIDEYRRITDRAEMRAANGIGEDAVGLLCVGTFEPRKAQAALVMAFAQIAASVPDAVKLSVGVNALPFTFTDQSDNIALDLAAMRRNV